MTAGLDTVGVRVPAHPAARALIAAAGTPLAAPSANPFGYVSPTTAAHVAELLGDAVDLVLDGGPCRVGLESTILSLAGEPVILRPGGLPREALEEALGMRAAGRRRERAAARARPAAEALRDAHAARDPRGARAGRSRRASDASACSRRGRRTPRASRPSRCWPRTARSRRPPRGSSRRCGGSTPWASTGSSPSRARRRASATRSWTGCDGRPRARPSGYLAARTSASSSSTQASVSGRSGVKRSTTEPSPETCTTLA